MSWSYDPQQYVSPPPAYTPQDMSMQRPVQLPAKAGDSPLLSIFTEGNVIILRSNSCGKSLRIMHGEVEGLGGQGPHAKFRVHVRRPTVVALQNVHNPDWWLAVYEGRTTGVGRGGPYCEFYVEVVEEKYIVLESLMYPGQHIAVLPDGTVKNPKNSHTGLHARFVPIVMETAPPPQAPPPQAPPPQPTQDYPPATYPQPTYPQPGYPSAPPPAVPPPASFPPPQPYPPQPHPPQPHPPQPHPPQPHPPQPHTPPLTGPQMPLGYNVLDAFQNGNVVQLIARSNGFPLQIKGAVLHGSGTFIHTDSQFVVVTPSGRGPGVVMLQNVKWCGCYIAIKGGRIHGDGKGGKFCHLRVHVLPDNYVYFESMEHPGQYVTMTSTGSVGSPVHAGPNDKNTQFFVRLERQKHNHSATIMTPFGRQSIANQLCDRGVVQLYLKSTNMYLAINNGGRVINTTNSGDKHTFFELVDRGMGIVSLHSYLYPGYRLRIVNFVMGGKGNSDTNADFRLLESQDGTVTFESVPCKGFYVGIQNKKVLQANLNIFLVNIQKFGGTETVTKTPLN